MSTDSSQQNLDGKEHAHEFLAFTLGKEHYGVDILAVQEIRGYDTVTRVPDSPDFIKGVINLRGTIVPVIDLRIKFHLGDVSYDELTVMIVFNFGGKIVGAVVDSVSDVVALDEEQIQSTPKMGGVIDTRYISGIASVNDRMLILLKMETIIMSADGTLSAVVDVAKQAA